MYKYYVETSSTFLIKNSNNINFENDGNFNIIYRHFLKVMFDSFIDYFKFLAKSNNLNVVAALIFNKVTAETAINTEHVDDTHTKYLNFKLSDFKKGPHDVNKDIFATGCEDLSLIKYIIRNGGVNLCTFIACIYNGFIPHKNVKTSGLLTQSTLQTALFKISDLTTIESILNRFVKDGKVFGTDIKCNKQRFEVLQKQFEDSGLTSKSHPHLAQLLNL